MNMNTPCTDQLLCGIYCTGNCQQPHYSPTIVTHQDLREAEIQMTAWARGRIGSPQDFVDAAHHFLDARVPAGFRLLVGWVGDHYELAIRGIPATRANAGIEVDDRT